MKTLKRIALLTALLTFMIIGTVSAQTYKCNRVYIVGQKVEPGFGDDIQPKNGLTWKTSKKKIATVSKNGLVTCKKKGKATITATNGTDTFVFNIKVTDHWEPVDGWELEGNEDDPRAFRLDKVYKNKIVITAKNTGDDPQTADIGYVQIGKKVFYTKNMKTIAIAPHSSRKITLTKGKHFKGTISFNKIDGWNIGLWTWTFS